MADPSHSRSKQKKELYKIAVARTDIFSAQKTCRVIIERIDSLEDELYAPLFHAAVIAYGRPFVDNKSTGVLSRHWSNFSDSRLQWTHNQLIKTRHEIVAHSDSNARAVHIIPPSARPKFGLPASNSVSLKIDSYYYPKQAFSDAFDTCADLMGRFNSRIEELLTTLYGNVDLQNELIPLTFDEGL